MPENRSVKLNSPAGVEDMIFTWKSDEEESEAVEVIHWVTQDVDELRKNDHLAHLLSTVNRSDFGQVDNLCNVYNSVVQSCRAKWNSRGIKPSFLNRKATREQAQFIISLCYNRAVRRPELLNQYQPFSPGVYGETSFELVSEIIDDVCISTKDIFIDLGSGVGQVVLQIAACTDAEFCHGIENAAYPAECAVHLGENFVRFMEFFGKPYRPFKLHRGDFLDSEYESLFSHLTFVFVNNFAFGPEVDHKLKLRFANLKIGSKVVSSKPYRPLNFRITDRNLGDIASMMTVRKLKAIPDAVSWTHVPLSYYLHVLDTTENAVSKSAPALHSTLSGARRLSPPSKSSEGTSSSSCSSTSSMSSTCYLPQLQSRRVGSSRNGQAACRKRRLTGLDQYRSRVQPSLDHLSSDRPVVKNASGGRVTTQLTSPVDDQFSALTLGLSSSGTSSTSSASSSSATTPALSAAATADATPADSSNPIGDRFYLPPAPINLRRGLSSDNLSKDSSAETGLDSPLRPTYDSLRQSDTESSVAQRRVVRQCRQITRTTSSQGLSKPESAKVHPLPRRKLRSVAPKKDNRSGHLSSVDRGRHGRNSPVGPLSDHHVRELHRETVVQVNTREKFRHEDGNNDPVMGQSSAASVRRRESSKSIRDVRRAVLSKADEAEKGLSCDLHIGHSDRPTPVAIDQYLALLRCQILNHLTQFKSTDYKSFVLKQLKFEQDRQSQLEKEVQRLENAVRDAHAAGVQLLKHFTQFLGMPVCNATEFFAQARALIKKHAELENLVAQYQAQSSKLASDNRELARLASSNPDLLCMASPVLRSTLSSSTVPPLLPPILVRAETPPPPSPRKLLVPAVPLSVGSAVRADPPNCSSSIPPPPPLLPVQRRPSPPTPVPTSSAGSWFHRASAPVPAEDKPSPRLLVLPPRKRVLWDESASEPATGFKRPCHNPSVSQADVGFGKSSHYPSPPTLSPIATPEPPLFSAADQSRKSPLPQPAAIHTAPPIADCY